MVVWTDERRTLWPIVAHVASFTQFSPASKIEESGEICKFSDDAALSDLPGELLCDLDPDVHENVWSCLR